MRVRLRASVVATLISMLIALGFLVASEMNSHQPPKQPAIGAKCE